MSVFALDERKPVSTLKVFLAVVWRHIHRAENVAADSIVGIGEVEGTLVMYGA